MARKLIYSMGVSLDGFINGPDGTFDWSAPDEELHQFHNDRVRELGAHLLGRRLYEVMTHWDGISTEGDGIEPDFARIGQALPKIVFSTTLEEVTSPNTRLASGGVAEEVAALK